jgi:tRNA pseudouridine13 synthase
VTIVVSEPIRLGDLGGNRFEIVLRGVKESEEVISNACRAISQNGFINYFGLQRFGKGGSKSHEIGMAIYKDEWKHAVDMMFTPREGDKYEIRTAKSLYNAGDLAGALRELPHNMNSEKSIIKWLLTKPNDFSGAFHSIPKNVRLICCHAYQSYIWNWAASERIRVFGMEVVEGDLVCVLEPGAVLDGERGDEILDAPDGLVHIEDGGDASEDKNTGHATAASSTAVADTGNAFQRTRKDPSRGIHVVTASDVAARTFTIRDVVLPLAGHGITLPGNQIGEYYTSLLQKDGLTISRFSVCQPHYRTGGAYRRLVQFPTDFQWEVLSYMDPSADLAVTELATLRPSNGSRGGADDSMVGAVSGEALRALVIKFTLSSGTYATILLRELTKESTESQYQAQLTADSRGSSAKVDDQIEPAESVEPSDAAHSGDPELQAEKKIRS